MQFINPGMLLTLGVIPVLILIHTLKPKPKQVEVNNLFLWQEVLKERSSHLTFERLKKNLPLLIQILIVILASLALAKPAWIFTRSKTGNMIIVIDTSASMKAKFGSGTRFDIARTKAFELIEQRDPDQQILIVDAGHRPTVQAGLIDDSNLAKRLVSKLKPSDASGDLEQSLYLALSFVDPSKADFLYLITDGAGGDISTLLKDHPKIRPIMVTGENHNIGITKFEFRQEPGRNDHYELMLEIKNFTPFPIECPIHLSIDNTVIFSKLSAFEAQEKKLMIFPYIGLISGIARADLEIDDDFSIDNHAYLSLNASKDIWVLLVSKGNYFLEKLLDAYPNFKVNRVKEIVASSWSEQTLRHDIVIVDRMDFPKTDKGNFLLIDSYSPSIPIFKIGHIRFPTHLDWNPKSPIMADVNVGTLIIEQAAKLKTASQLQPVLESAQTGLMYAYEKAGLRAVLMGFDLSQSDLPLKVAFPVMMSNIINWLNPHRLEFSTLHTRAGEPFEIYLKPQTSTFYTRAPQEKWERHRASTNPFRYMRTHKVGVYTISENDKQRYFTVNLADEIESDIAASFIEPPDEKTDGALAADEISVQQPLWSFLILMGLGMLFLEWYFWLKM
ncbi:MAG: BatA and WFA domain-containing protein [Desulfobacteraceae bacterium]